MPLDARKAFRSSRKRNHEGSAMNKLAVIVLGNRNSGKTATWNELFGQVVRTGTEIRNLSLGQGLEVPVFLVSGSPEERGLYVGDIIGKAEARIVLCSLQYAEGARESVQFFQSNGFELFVQWLNPGYSDEHQYADRLGFCDLLLFAGATIQCRDGTGEIAPRVRDIRNFMIGWVTNRRFRD
jgi:hypothetical protein